MVTEHTNPFKKGGDRRNPFQKDGEVPHDPLIYKKRSPHPTAPAVEKGGQILLPLKDSQK